MTQKQPWQSSNQGSQITRHSQNTDQTAKFFTKGDGSGGAAPATMSVKNKSATSEHTEEAEEDGSGTIRHVIANTAKGSDSD